MFVCYGHNTYVPSTAIRNSVNFPLEPFFWSAFVPFTMLTTLARVQNLQMCLWLCMGSATPNAAFTRIATCRNNRYAFHEGADILFFFFVFVLAFFITAIVDRGGKGGTLSQAAAQNERTIAKTEIVIYIFVLPTDADRSIRLQRTHHTGPAVWPVNFRFEM